MQDFCPLCMRDGVKKRLKLLQINLHETVWACESEKCVWPFGFEEFIYSPRPVGRTWSCYWDDQRPAIPKLRGTAATTAEPQMNNLITAISKSTLNKHLGASCLDTTQIENISNACPVQEQISNDIGVLPKQQIKSHIERLFKSETDNTDKVKVEENSVPYTTVQGGRENYAKTSDVNVQSCAEEKNVCGPVSDPQSVDALHLNDDKPKLVDNAARSTNVNINDRSRTNSPNVQSVKKNLDSRWAENVSIVRGVPKITSIARMNIDTTSMRARQISACDDSSKGTLNISKSNNAVSDSALVPEAKPTNTLTILRKLQRTEPQENMLCIKQEAVESDLNITTVQMAGLPAITVSYKMPGCPSVPDTVAPTVHQANGNRRVANSPNRVASAINVATKNTRVAKRHVTSGKQYAKFSFSALKRKTDDTGDTVSDLTDKIGNGNSSGSRKSESFKEFDDSNNAVKNEICGSSINRDSNVESSNDDANQSNVSKLDTSAVNTSANIHSMLEDLLTSDLSVSEHINDDWINSFFN